MDDNHCRAAFGVGVPMAVAQNLRFGIHPIQTFFRRGQLVFARKEVSGQRHGVPIAQITARDKWIKNRVSWIFSHAAANCSCEFAYNNDAVDILNEPATMPIFEYVCQQCNHQFEALVMSKQKAACPKCESKRRSQHLSSLAGGGEKPRAAAPAGGISRLPRQSS